MHSLQGRGTYHQPGALPAGEVILKSVDCGYTNGQFLQNYKDRFFEMIKLY